MKRENKLMQEFLRRHGIDARVKWLTEGSCKGSWRLYHPTAKWTAELATLLNALGFTSLWHEPLDRFSGNGGAFSVMVRGNEQFAEEGASL